MLRVLVVLQIFQIAYSADFVSSVQLCRKSDPNIGNCLIIGIKQAVDALASGCSAFNLQPLNAFKLEEFLIPANTGTDHADERYKTISVYGLANDVTITDAKINLVDLSIDFESFFPNITVVGEVYRDNRTFVETDELIPMKLVLGNTFFVHKIRGEKYTKDNKEYLRILQYKIHMTPVSIKFNVGSAINVEVDLGDPIWKAALPSFSSDFNPIFIEILRSTANKVFENVPFDSIFLD